MRDSGRREPSGVLQHGTGGDVVVDLVRRRLLQAVLAWLKDRDKAKKKGNLLYILGDIGVMAPEGCRNYALLQR